MATIIRRGGDRSGEPAETPTLADFTFSDMAVQGDEYVRRVRAEAAKEVAKARAEADRIRADAEAAGRAAADQAIARMLDDRMAGELKTLRPALEDVVARLRAAHGEWLDHWRSSAVSLAVAIAERIVRRELRADPSISEAWLEEALRYAAGASDVTVRLAPADHEHLHGHAEQLAEVVSAVAATRFVADEAVTPGGCVVETRHGSIDQQVETQLERLHEELDS